MKYRVFNISRTASSPGINLQWTDDKGRTQQIVPRPPHNWKMIDEISERFFTWQANGWAKIEPLDDPLKVMNEELAKMPVPAVITEAKIGEEIGDEDLGYPDFNTGEAVEAALPGDAANLNSAPINQDTHQGQDQGAKKKSAGGKKGRGGKKSAKTPVTPGSPVKAKATVMGETPLKAIDKGAEVNALNPLLDETAKSVDNVSDNFVAKAPARTEFERGTTIL